MQGVCAVCLPGAREELTGEAVCRVAGGRGGVRRSVLGVGAVEVGSSAGSKRVQGCRVQGGRGHGWACSTEGWEWDGVGAKLLERWRAGGKPR